MNARSIARRVVQSRQDMPQASGRHTKRNAQALLAFARRLLVQAGHAMSRFENGGDIIWGHMH